MRRRRGSAMLYVVAAAGAAAVLVMANLGVATTGRRVFARTETELRMRYARESAAEMFSARAALGGGAADDPFAFDLAGRSVSVQVSLASGRLATIETKMDGLTVSDPAVDPRGWSPFLYALFVNGKTKLDGNLRINGSSPPASAFFGDSLDGDPNATIAGSVDATPNLRESDIGSVGGTIRTGLAASALPNRRLVLLPDETYLLPTTINGRGAGLGAVRRITSTADVTVSGNFSANCVISTAGKIHLQPPITVSNGARLVLVANNTVDADGGGNVYAFIYSATSFDAKEASVTVVGAVAAADLKVKNRLTINYDPFFWDDPASVDDFLLPNATAPN